MCPKIRYDGESKKFCKLFWELNRAAVYFTSLQKHGRIYWYRITKPNSTKNNGSWESLILLIYFTRYKNRKKKLCRVRSIGIAYHEDTNPSQPTADGGGGGLPSMGNLRALLHA
jgi:hypothetical protein